MNRPSTPAPADADYLLTSLSRQVNRLALTHGETPTPVPWLSFLLLRQGSRHTLPDASALTLLLPLQGSLSLSVESCPVFLHAGQHGPGRLPATVEAKAEGHSGADVLAISLSMEVDEVVGVLLAMEAEDPGQLMGGRAGVPSIRDSTRLGEALLRLFCCLNQKDGKVFMAQHVKQEIIYDLMTGNGGMDFVQSALRLQQTGEIYKVNSWIKRHYRRPFSVGQLARCCCMSLSAFYQKFKRATGMSPIQCQKQLRLQEARRLTLNRGMNVTEAAFHVGYESLSQFIRDYRKMFAATPLQDVRKHAGNI